MSFTQLFESESLFFTVPALVGGGLFALRLLGMLAGGVAEGADLDTDADLGGDVHGDSTSAFELISLQSLAAFAMGFGTAGLAARHGFDASMTTSVLVAVGFGVAMLWLFGMGMKAVYDLQSSGNVALHDAVGLEGEIVIAVPDAGTGRGRVRLVVRQRQRTFNAVTDGPELPSRSRVRVTGTRPDNCLVVAAL